MTLDVLAPQAALGDPQRIAADPSLSAFVTANAGSGKTKTLIDRVARLLLAGAAPETILCVTYTKAAASEMQRRLFDVLGEWSVLPDADLSEKLARLEDRPFARTELSTARSLFAKALETPGGLKIQTIHAFCEKLLRRFPLEAGVSPGFRVMDDSAAASVAGAARRMVARMALGADNPVAEAYARLSVALDFQSFQAMFGDFEARRGALKDFLDREGGLQGALAWVEKKALTDRTNVQIKSPMAVALVAPDVASPIVFRAETGVLLTLVTPQPPNAGAWAQVRHRDGQVGFVRVDALFGL